MGGVWGGQAWVTQPLRTSHVALQQAHPLTLMMACLEMSYVAIMPTFMAMARHTVGSKPRHRFATPSSLEMRDRASNTFLYPRRSATGC